MSSRRSELESSLGEMERRLRELQAELSAVDAPAPVSQTAVPSAGAPSPASRSAGPVDEALERVGELGRRLEDLQRLRDELETATLALRDEVLAGDAGAPAGGGDFVVDVGPFPDIATLSAFEHALRRLPSVGEAWVRGYAGDRAQIDVRQVGPGDLVAEMRSALGFRFDVVAVGRGEVTLSLERPGA